MVRPSEDPGGPPAARDRAARILWAAALLWPSVLALVLVLFRFVGEGAWPVVPLLYLPRHPWILPGLLILPFALRRGRRALLWPLAAGALLWLFPLMGFVAPHPSGAVAGPTIRVLSYNTGHAVDGTDGLRALLRATRPDVVLFQWTSRQAEEAFQGPDFQGWTVRRVDQFTVASRFPVLSAEAAGFPSRYGPPGAHAVLATPLGALDLFTIRPKSARAEVAATRHRTLRQRVHDFAEDLRSGRLSELAALREAQTRSISEEISRARNLVLVAGDTNLPDGSLLLRSTLGGLQDAFAQASWGLGYTHPAKLPWMRLDRVLMGPGLRAASFAVLPRLASGHRAVVAEIGLAPAR